MIDVETVETWEEFEEKLERLQKKQSGLLFRGQENSCWPITTTLERPPDGRVSMPFGDYYLSIYQSKPAIESYTEKGWDVPDPPEVKSLTERVEPFVSFTKEAFKTWGQVWSYMVHLRHFGFPSPFLDWTPLSIHRGLLCLPATDQRRGKSIYLRLLRNAKCTRSSQGLLQ